MMADQTDVASHSRERPQKVLYVLIAVVAFPMWFGSIATAANLSRGTETAKKFGVHEVASVREALGYPHYVQIGVPPQIAREVGQDVKDCGKELYVTVKRLTTPVRETLEQVPMDAIGTENVTELFKFLGISK